MAESGLDLGKQVGPLPMGAWIAVGGIGLAIGYFINRNAAKKQSDQPQQLPDSDVGRGGLPFSTVNPTAPTQEPALPETNQSWGNKVIQWLIGQQFDATIADGAVRKYLNGQTLSLDERAMISLALAHFGPPPENVSGPPDDPRPKTPSNLSVTMKTSNSVSLAWPAVTGATSYEVVASSQFGSWPAQTTIIPAWSSGTGLGSNLDHTFYVWAVNEFGKSEPAQISVKTNPGGPVETPAPNPAPAPAPAPAPVGRTYTIVGGDTLWAIASRFYGTGTRWIEIYNANAGVIEAAARAHGHSSSRGPTGSVGWWIFPGTQLRIP